MGEKEKGEKEKGEKEKGEKEKVSPAGGGLRGWNNEQSALNFEL